MVLWKSAYLLREIGLHGKYLALGQGIRFPFWPSHSLIKQILAELLRTKLVSEAPWVMKIRNSISRENLVMTSAYERPIERMPSVQTLGVEEGRLEVGLTGDLRYIPFSRRDLSGKKKLISVFVMSTYVWGRWANVLGLKYNMKENYREQELAARKVAKKIAKERPRPRARKLNSEQCRELNQVRARERRWNNTEECRESGPVSALEKNWNARKIDSEVCRTSRNDILYDMQPCKKSCMFSSADQQEDKFNVFGVFRGITGK